MGSYTIDVISHFDKIAEKNIRLTTGKSFSIPFRRHGVQTKEDPERTIDEPLRTPLEKLYIPKQILEEGQKIINEKKFTPGWLANLQGVIVENGFIYVRANVTNYGVLPTLRELTNRFPDELMIPVLNQIAPLAVHAVTISTKQGQMYLARRVNVDCSGQIASYPAGTVKEGHDIRTTLREEAIEEANMKIGINADAYITGLAKCRAGGPNPNFTYIIETPWSFEEMAKNTSRKEHDKVFAIPLDEKEIAKRMKEDLIFKTAEHDKILDMSLAAILQAGRVLFGTKWYSNTVGELNEIKSPQIRITESAIYEGISQS